MPADEALFEPRGITPTAEQRAIQLARKPHLIIEANAGAAKTTTLALRLAQALLRGADPQRVLVLTYTDAAVQAFKDAMARIGIAPETRRLVRVLTFEAFCTERLRAIEGQAVPQHEQAERLRPHVLQAIDQVLHDADERHPDEFTLNGRGEGSVEGLLASFLHLKGTMLLTREAADRRLSPTLAAELGHDYPTLRLFRAYEHLRRGGHPDHPAFRGPHDATYDLARLLLDEDAWLGEPHALELGLHLVLVDEMHDTHRAMFTVLCALMRRNRAAFVGVGDRDQVIHSVAGADAAFMGEAFDREVAQATRMPLSTSWRFGRTLAQAVGRLASKPCQAQSQWDTAVTVLDCRTPQDLRTQLGELIGAHTEVASQMAVLLRQPHQSVALENHLLDQGVAYRTEGFDTYLLRPEVLFVRGLWACLTDRLHEVEHPDTRAAMLRALLLFTGSRVDTGAHPTDLPPEPDELDRLEQAALKEVCQQPALARTFLDNQVLRNAPAAARACVEDALDAMERDDIDLWQRRFLRDLRIGDLATRVLVRGRDIAQVQANLAVLVDSAQGHDHLTSFFRITHERELRLRGMTRKHCLLLAGIEAVKGLEFDHVIVPGLSRGEFAIGGHSVDNRNLLYVALTRARRRLTLLCDLTRPSAYLRDAGLI